MVESVKPDTSPLNDIESIADGKPVGEPVMMTAAGENVGETFTDRQLLQEGNTNNKVHPTMPGLAPTSLVQSTISAPPVVVVQGNQGPMH